MIDIIIPAYNAHETIKDTLESIASQSIKDKINVYIINDFSDKDYSEEISIFKNKLDVKEINTGKNMGPGYARQLGIDSSNSEFIVFIDADDEFYNNKAIEILYNTIKENKCDVVVGSFNEILKDGRIIKHDKDTIWLHGKIYRRSFLDKNIIRFTNTYSNEDTGFNKLVMLCTNMYYIDDITYIWKYNSKSITNSSEFDFSGIDGFVYNICWAISEGEKRKCNPIKMGIIVYETMLEVYYRYVYYKNKRKDVDDIIKWSKELKKYYLKYNNYVYPVMKEELVLNTFTTLYRNLGNYEVILDNNISFNSFLELID